MCDRIRGTANEYHRLKLKRVVTAVNRRCGGATIDRIRGTVNECRRLKLRSPRRDWPASDAQSGHRREQVVLGLLLMI